MDVMTIEQHYTVEDVAAALKKHTRTILRWIDAGKIKVATLPGRGNNSSYRIPRSELERMGVSFVDDNTEILDD